MTLKEELEILRGEPIEVLTGDPMEIPCIEMSDPEKLCKHPVVSVHMITYNHEPYIRQAIEGVMMQKTNFEFELVIGEDCSQDKTREICFEYQKKYPDKIRVLWWHENVSKRGGNSWRVLARCRGEFIALCEGDDYWTDVNKLQLQVDAMRGHPEVSLCSHLIDVLQNGRVSRWDMEQVSKLNEDRGDGVGFCFSADDTFRPGTFIHTATVMVRQNLVDWSFLRNVGRLLDLAVFCAALRGGDGYFIYTSMATYRIHSGGIWQGKSRIDRARWILPIMMRIMDADPEYAVGKRLYENAVRDLQDCLFPYRQILWMRKKLYALGRKVCAMRSLMWRMMSKRT